MYLVDKKGREFETKEAHEQFIQQADAVGRWEKSHHISERKRLTWFYPDYGVHVPKDWVSRNEIAEKFNEITGRQMIPELDPVVEMRSSVHSNYANMVAMLGADNRVYLGKEENYHYTPGQPGFYDNKDGSLCFVSDQPDMYYFLYGEGWAPLAGCHAGTRPDNGTVYGICTFAGQRSLAVYRTERNFICRQAFSATGKLSSQYRIRP